MAFLCTTVTDALTLAVIALTIAAVPFASLLAPPVALYVALLGATAVICASDVLALHSTVRTSMQFFYAHE